MKSIDSKKLNELIGAERWAEAKTLLDSHLREPMTLSERGQVYAELASVYMEVQSELLKRYEAGLDHAINILQRINKAEKQVLQGQMK